MALTFSIHMLIFSSLINSFLAYESDYKFSATKFSVKLSPLVTSSIYEFREAISDEAALNMVKTASSRFHQFFVHYPILSRAFKSEVNSLQVITLATAELNRIRNTTEFENRAPLAITLISVLSQRQREKNLTIILKKLKHAADEANNIYPGTVTRIGFSEKILFSQGYNFSLLKTILENIRNYKISVEFSIESCNEWGNGNLFTRLVNELSINGIIFRFATTEKDYRNGVSNTLSKFTTSFENCVNLTTSIFRNVESSPEILFRVRWGDTSPSGYVQSNHTGLVEFWRGMDMWAKTQPNNVGVILEQVFDISTEASKDPSVSSTGWWRVGQNFSLKNKFYFIEKASLIDENRESISLKRLKNRRKILSNEIRFSKRHTGVWLNTDITYQENKLKVPKIFEFCTQLFDKAFSEFQTLVFNIKSFTANWDTCVCLCDSADLNLSVGKLVPVFDPTLSSLHLASRWADVINSRNNNTVQLILMETMLATESVSQTQKLLQYASNHLVNNTIGSYHIGIILPLETCDSVRDFEFSIKPLIEYANVLVFVVYLEPVEVKLGAERIAAKRIAQFENCMLVGRNWTAGVKIGFQTHWTGLNYETKQYNWVGYVEFWNSLNKWAERNEVLMLIENAFDAPISEKEMFRDNGWWRLANNQTLRSGQSLQFTQKRDLALQEIDQKIYAIEAEIRLRNKQKTPQQAADLLWLLLVIAVLFGIVIAIVAVVYIKLIKNRMPHSLIESFIQGTSSHEGIWAIGEKNYVEEKYKTEFEIPKQSIILGPLIGMGNFGVVYTGSVNGIKVAIKKPKKTYTHEVFKSMLNEVKIMSSIGNHQNLVDFVGANTRDAKNGKIFVVTKLCANGTLQNHLKSINNGSNGNTGKVLCSYDLYRFCYEIAAGMEFISEKQVVHGDLSTRNVLLDERFVCKISDFGLSSKLNENGEYFTRAEGAFPWRWIALEFLKNNVMTNKSDAWSFGVTVWEIFSLGETPYGDSQTMEGFVDKLENGWRLKRPKHLAVDSIYEKMKLCWDTCPSERPEFAELKSVFENFMSDPQDRDYKLVLRCQVELLIRHLRKEIQNSSWGKFCTNF